MKPSVWLLKGAGQILTGEVGESTTGFAAPVDAITKEFLATSLRIITWKDASKWEILLSSSIETLPKLGR